MLLSSYALLLHLFICTSIHIQFRCIHRQDMVTHGKHTQTESRRGDHKWSIPPPQIYISETETTQSTPPCALPPAPPRGAHGWCRNTYASKPSRAYSPLGHHQRRWWPSGEYALLGFKKTGVLTGETTGCDHPNCPPRTTRS